MYVYIYMYIFICIYVYMYILQVTTDFLVHFNFLHFFNSIRLMRKFFVQENKRNCLSLHK